MWYEFLEEMEENIWITPWKVRKLARISFNTGTVIDLSENLEEKKCIATLWNNESFWRWPTLGPGFNPRDGKNKPVLFK